MKGESYMLSRIYDKELKSVWERFSKTVNYSFAVILGLVTFLFLFGRSESAWPEVLEMKIVLGSRYLLIILFSSFLFIGSSELSGNIFNPNKQFSKLYHGIAVKLLPWLLIFLGGNLLYSFIYSLVTFSEIITFFIVIILWLELKNKTGRLISENIVNMNPFHVS